MECEEWLEPDEMGYEGGPNSSVKIKPVGSQMARERLQIFNFGDANFAVFEGVGLLREFRLLCHSIYRPKDEDNDLPTLPVVLMPEQVQVLLENGFAQLIGIKDAGEGHSDTLIAYETGTRQGGMTNDVEYIQTLARKVVVGRKIKARKRLLLDGSDVPSEALKVRKLDLQKFAAESMDGEGGEDTACSPEELEAAMEEIRRRETEKRRKISTKDDGALLPQMLAYVGPSSSLEVVKEDSPFPQSAEYCVKLTVFRDLWRKGFYLASGAKFGCDYLVYEKPPSEQHSNFMVVCADVNNSLRPLSLISVSRASTQVKKKVLLAMVSSGSLVPYYVEMNWWKGDGNR